MGVFTDLFTAILTYLTQLTGNLGLAIIVLTTAIRLVLTPISLLGLRMAKKMQLAQPELEKLQTKYKKDPKKLQQAQMELYKKHSINPVAGCLPQIVQIGVLIVLYQSFIQFFNQPATDSLKVMFFGVNMTEPSPWYVWPLLAGATQLLLSLMSLAKPVKNNDKKVVKKSKEPATTPSFTNSLTSSLQTQMVFVFPIITFVISLNFPSGLVLYWVISTLISMAQQYYVGGWGKLAWYVEVLKNKKTLTNHVNPPQP